MSEILWEASEAERRASQMYKFMEAVSLKFKLSLSSYQELHTWACEHPDDFWAFYLAYSDIQVAGTYSKVKSQEVMPGVKWFEGLSLNYSQNCLGDRGDHCALICVNEKGDVVRSSYRELKDKVSCVVQYFKAIGVGKGDRVAGVVTNGEAAIVVFLATAACGAIWTSVSPDFGEEAILSRFRQVSPKVLLSVDAYDYKGKRFSIREKRLKVAAELEGSCAHIVIGRRSHDKNDPVHTSYHEILNDYDPAPIEYEAVGFNDPLYILYSSGTTGEPKSITHAVGGTLMEHIKEQRLHCNLTDRDVLFYYTSCSWMMWNWLTSGLASGATLLIFDGAPYYPNPTSTWKLIDDHKVTIYGTSAKYINASLKMDLDVSESLDLSSLKVILSTGSPLYEDDFDYIYQKVKKDVQLSSISGGTDIVGCFTLGNPLLPVVRGQCQCISLGYPVKAYDESGNSVVGQEGELICEKAVPSMPITLWGDREYQRYKKSYFEKHPQVWNHADYILITEQGGVKVLGRSDATLNRAGIRIGTAEIYRLVESLDTIEDSLVIHIEQSDRMVLFLKTSSGLELDEDLKRRLQQMIKKELSPRHCPDQMLQVSDIPYTKNGKKVELAVKTIFSSEERSISLTSLTEPNVLDEYRALKNSHPNLLS